MVDTYSPVFQEAAEYQVAIQKVLDHYRQRMTRLEMKDLVAAKVSVSYKSSSLEAILSDPKLGESEKRQMADQKSRELERAFRDAQELCREINSQLEEAA